VNLFSQNIFNTVNLNYKHPYIIFQRTYPDSTIASSLNGDKINLSVEFESYKEAKDAKTLLAKLHNSDVLKIESQLFKVIQITAIKTSSLNKNITQFYFT